jgi:ubiquinone/menaquinone biosynthesis C-methylase UbiE
MELRQDYRAIEALYEARRTPDRIIAHYELERSIADELRQSSKAQRDAGLYQDAYDRLLGGLPDHPRKTLHSGDRAARMGAYVERQSKMLIRELGKDDIFVDMGGGDCRLALLVAPHVAQSIVVEVSDALLPETVPANFKFVKTPGVIIPLENESVSFVYSNQLMEHLHPDDAAAQMREIFRVLKPGGRYLCRTPSRFSGPHDVSMFFSSVAQGMHLKEYSYKELRALMRNNGFARTRIWIAPRAYRAFVLPQFAGELIEAVFALVPSSLHTRVCRSKVARALLGITMMADKPA